MEETEAVLVVAHTLLYQEETVQVGVRLVVLEFSVFLAMAWRVVEAAVHRLVYPEIQHPMETADLEATAEMAFCSLFLMLHTEVAAEVELVLLFSQLHLIGNLWVGKEAQVAEVLVEMAAITEKDLLRQTPEEMQQHMAVEVVAEVMTELLLRTEEAEMGLLVLLSWLTLTHCQQRAERLPRPMGSIRIRLRRR